MKDRDEQERSMSSSIREADNKEVSEASKSSEFISCVDAPKS
jgi:hypothetical protein